MNAVTLLVHAISDQYSISNIGIFIQNGSLLTIQDARKSLPQNGQYTTLKKTFLTVLVVFITNGSRWPFWMLKNYF